MLVGFFSFPLVFELRLLSRRHLVILFLEVFLEFRHSFEDSVTTEAREVFLQEGFVLALP